MVRPLHALNKNKKVHSVPDHVLFEISPKVHLFYPLNFQLFY